MSKKAVGLSFLSMKLVFGVNPVAIDYKTNSHTYLATCVVFC